MLFYIALELLEQILFETHVILYGPRTCLHLAEYSHNLRTMLFYIVPEPQITVLCNAPYICTFAATFYRFPRRVWREVSCLIGRTALSHL